MLCALLAVGSAAARAQASGTGEGASLPRMVVTSSGQPQPEAWLAGNTTRIGGATVNLVGAVHVSQLLFRSPGTWISRGSGQEHLTAIRSPVLTGAGACGAFMFLEDGIPIRPAGFCNVNQLFEVNSEQADAVEVIRGPGSALYGSNAMHGMVNFIGADPRFAGPGSVSVESGSDDYYRGLLDTGAGRARLRLNATHDGSFREAAGFDQYKLNGDLDVADDLRMSLAATELHQETAGYIPGFEAYRDEALRHANFNPEAFRDARSERAALHWDPPGGLEAHAYARSSRMSFLRHFVPEKSLEENGQDSMGLMLRYDWLAGTERGLVSGMDLELTRGFLLETQDHPVRGASEFLRETRPAGKHYDYDVHALQASPYAQLSYPLADDWRLTAGLRAEYLRYEYANHLPPGNSRDDGSQCGFGGCLFNRPADRSDAFFNVAPKLGLVYAFDDHLHGWVRLARGFRAPQATELYRLQRGQDVADLHSVTLDSLEVGIRGRRGPMRFETDAYFMDKRHVILTDADGFNVSDGHTRHRGVEAEVNWTLTPRLSAALAATYAIHRYAFDRVAALGEHIESGNDVDTAPRTLGSARLEWRYAQESRAELEWVHMGAYWLDAANEHRYPGHELLNLRIEQRLGERWRLGARITNLFDVDYAERADYAFGDYRYFPGPGRQVFVELGTSF